MSSSVVFKHLDPVSPTPPPQKKKRKEKKTLVLCMYLASGKNNAVFLIRLETFYSADVLEVNTFSTCL